MRRTPRTTISEPKWTAHRKETIKPMTQETNTETAEMNVIKISGFCIWTRRPPDEFFEAIEELCRQYVDIDGDFDYQCEVSQQ